MLVNYGFVVVVLFFRFRDLRLRGSITGLSVLMRGRYRFDRIRRTDLLYATDKICHALLLLYHFVTTVRSRSIA